MKGVAINAYHILSVKEMRTAEQEIFKKLEQREEFVEEYNLFMRKADRSSYVDIMLELGLYVENDLRCGGRHYFASMPEIT